MLVVAVSALLMLLLAWTLALPSLRPPDIFL
jgi:hypothetical protein